MSFCPATHCMKLIEALEILKQNAASDAPPARLLLACGFTPLHLATFLKANLQLRMPSFRVDLETGLFGDLAGNLERAAASPFAGAAVVIEWADLDPRLGLRQLGGWGPQVLPDLIASATRAAQRLETALERLSAKCPVAVSLPTLPLPPCFVTAGWQAGAAELEVLEVAAALSRHLAALPHVRILNAQQLDRESPPADRHDVKSELLNGFPYRQPHAATLARLLAVLLENKLPKKGLITDLDDTLWRGILGEVGAQGVTWDLASHSQIHGVYQQFLNALAESGVLVAVASKNDATLVDEALNRTDLHIGRDRLFPIEAHWHPKSESVSRILRTWNINADSVIFIDDSPMELAEAAAAHPGLETALFTPKDPDAVLRLLEHLRDAFGKSTISEEDRIRAQSIRNAAVLQEAAAEGGENQEAFLRQAEASIQLSFHKDPSDPRPFELVNKTNQFNLNGRRYTEAEWKKLLEDKSSFLATVSYRDKFGPLGKIAVIAGRKDGDGLRIETWVMSCRAFSRRIEHRCLHELFARFNAREAVLDFLPTPRNGPTQEFLSILGTPQPEFRLTREHFEASCPPLYHTLEEVEVAYG